MCLELEDSVLSLAVSLPLPKLHPKIAESFFHLALATILHHTREAKNWGGGADDIHT